MRWKKILAGCTAFIFSSLFASACNLSVTALSSAVHQSVPTSDSFYRFASSCFFTSIAHSCCCEAFHPVRAFRLLLVHSILYWCWHWYLSFSWGTPVAVIYCISIKYLTAFLVLFNYPPSTHSLCGTTHTSDTNKNLPQWHFRSYGSNINAYHAIKSTT